MNISQRRAAQTDGRRHIGQTAFHQHHIRRVNRHIGARTNGNADIGAGQGRGVIDAVPDHDDVSFLLQLTDYALLAVRKHTGNHFVNAGPRSDRFRRALVIARQHYHMDAHILHFLYRPGTVLFDRIRNGDNTAKLTAAGKEQRRFSFFRKPLGFCLYFIRHRDLFADKLIAAAKQDSTAQRSGKSVAR